MSGIAAIFNLDGHSVEKRLIVQMLDVIAHRGPDGREVWCDGPVALGHLMFHTTPESLKDRQPLRDETACLIVDGRIDNAAELRPVLEANGFHLRSDTDAELILRSYQCWGELFVQKLIGDFALVIWDARTRTLLCARDALGIKPFYYYADGRIFICGSEIRALLASPEVPCQPNEGVVGEYLANRTPTCEETIYRSIMRLRPGHILIVGPGRISNRRYFDLDFSKEVRFRNDEEYAEHFRDLFKEAVRCRLRGVGPVASELSGGLDSSSIVCTTRSLFQNEAAPCQDFEAYSLTFPGLACDETAYIREVADHTGVRANLLESTPSSEIDYVEQIREHRDFPEYPNSACMLGLRRLAYDRHCRIMLTGSGGDEWLSGCSIDNADLLRRGKLLSLIRQVRMDALQSPIRIGKKISSLHILLANGVMPLLPRTMQTMAHRMAGHKQSFPDWINPDFARRISLEERLNQAPEISSAPGAATTEPHGKVKKSTSVARRNFYEYFHDGEMTVTMDRTEHSMSRSGLEARHPFFDQRIVEFAWAIPEDQCRRSGLERLILRNAMRGILPELIRTRITKGEFNRPFTESLKFYSGKVRWENLNIARLGWVDASRLKAALTNLMESYDNGVEQYGVRVWLAIAMEIWHKTIFGATN
jgi:asparagine synthase (glutamine-hydrolysing)